MEIGALDVGSKLEICREWRSCRASQRELAARFGLPTKAIYRIVNSSEAASVDISEKRCSGCRQDKPISEYFKGKGRAGYRSKCKTCWKTECDRWEHANVERVRAYNRRSYWKDPEKGRAMGRNHHRDKGRQRTYGIGLAEYTAQLDRAMLDAQGGVCKICRKPERRVVRGKITQMTVDHCHKTGRVRGLLCVGCNFMLGAAKDDPTILDRAAGYLRDV